MEGTAFVDLRKLADWFASGARTALHIEKIIHRLGPTCVPLLGRELTSRDRRRRECARSGLAALAHQHRARVISELQRVATDAPDDDAKVCALGLLAELGERGAARFHDVTAIRKKSALALASQLDGPGELAVAADMMVCSLGGEEMLQLLAVMAEAAPESAQRLAAELAARLDLDVELRERIVDLAPPIAPPALPTPRAAHVTILVDARARIVIVAVRKIAGERRWRRWAVLIGQAGRLDDCVFEEGAPEDAAPLVANLVDDGYRVAGSDFEHARALVAAAARQAAESAGLTSAYYLGRDLLDLGEAHLGGRAHAHPRSATVGRAVELIEAGDPSRAQQLLARCDLHDPDVAAAAAACAMIAGAQGDAIAHLARAIEAEPDWPLHHWNLAAACHQLGDPRGCYHALRRFVATSSRASGLYGDPEQPARVALALRLIGELERTSRLAGTPLSKRRRRRTRRSATSSRP